MSAISHRISDLLKNHRNEQLKRNSEKPKESQEKKPPAPLPPPVVEKLTTIFELHLSALWSKNDMLHSEKKITVQHNGRRFLVKTLDVSSNKTTESFMVIQNNIDEDIKDLKQCVVDGFENDRPLFHLPKHTWSLKQYNIALLEFKQELIWQIASTNNAFKKIARFPIILHTQLNRDICSLNTTLLYQKYISIRFGIDVDNDSIASFLKNFTITHLKNTPELTYVPFNVFIQPLSQKSRIDERLEVSQYNWAVTLVTNGEGSSGNHAVIAIEGLNENNEYFMHKADYDGHSIHSHSIERKDLYIETRTEIWMRAHDCVKAMLKKIDREKATPPPFCKCGSKSIFSKEGAENCFTWAISMLRIAQIDIEKGSFDFIVSRTKRVTEKPKFYENIPVDIKL